MVPVAPVEQSENTRQVREWPVVVVAPSLQVKSVGEAVEVRGERLCAVHP